MEQMIDQNESSIFTERPVVYASFWERFAASFLDGLVINIPIYIIYYLIDGSLLDTSITSRIVGIVIGWMYYAALESGPHQATLGKRAMNIKVTDMNGDRISFAKATGRFFGKMVSGIILGIGYLMMLWDDKKQTLHDRMAGTLVVMK